MKFALAGNPNCGKTTLFNALTGATAHVGNWAGVTVEKREGVYKKLPEKAVIVDLPGIYSLSPYTPEEVISRNFILDENPDCVINIVDATNLERNLYLTTQLLEMDVPVVVALNMMDALQARGDRVNERELEKKIGVPVVSLSALKKQGIEELMKRAYETAKAPRKGYSVLQSSPVKTLLETTARSIESDGVKSPLFHAAKLIEGDEIELSLRPVEAARVAEAKKGEEDFEAVVADARYRYITEHFSATIEQSKRKEKLSRSDKIDKVLTHRVWGIPIFLAIMFVIFHLTFGESLFYISEMSGGRAVLNSPIAIDIFSGMGYEGLLEEMGEEVTLAIPSPGVFLQSWMGFLTGAVVDGVGGLFESAGLRDTWYAGLVCDGVLSGLDAVCSFIPQIMLLFLFLAILEDSGYMARVAFIMDRAFRKFGLSGKAFIPLLMGFGCSVPAMMACKTLEGKEERDMTIRLSPFFSCGAKAPIWAMLSLVAVLGGLGGGVFVFLIYLLGIVVAIVSALFMKLFSKNYEAPPFIMELPAYHRPQAGNVGAHLWEKLKHYVKKAGTIITAALIATWFLSSFSWAFWEGMVDIEDSIIASLGKVLQYFFYPCGFSQGEEGWRYTVSALLGLVAKEDVVAQMAQFGLTEETLSLSVSGIFAFAAYNLFTFPCFAAIAAAKSESSKKGFAFTMLFWFFGSYLLSALIYQVGTLLETMLPVGIIVVVVLIAAILLLGVFAAKRRARKTAIAQ